MLVYGDATRREAVAHKLARLRGQLAAARDLPPGVGRHALLVDALIEAGEIAQGIADARFAAAGRRDGRWPDAEAAMALTCAMARRCARSWQRGFADLPADEEARVEASASRLPAIELEVKQPEGYAFYALYPEAFFAAAQQLGGPPWRVIGLRSIGTSLAAMVAAALGDDAPLTLRPIGHPFDRRVAWQHGALAMAGARHAVVDEGPGLSGSSVAGVVRQLRAEGVAPARIHLFPGHGNGPGAQAGDATRALWAETASHVVGFDALILHAREPVHRLRTWVEEIVGPLRAPLQEITGGGWRAAHGARDAGALPAHPWQERRKFLAHAAAGTWLVKFIGLGDAARQRHACARQLAAAGFSPSVAGLCHGFIVERWHGELAPLSPARLGEPALRARLVARLADYIAFRARAFALPDQPGASLQALHEAGRHNAAEALGEAVGAQAWVRHAREAARMQPRVRAVRTDNRMHAWEWLDDGERLLKTDAVDHHAGHDLVGCQDAAWDVAGAAAEFGLSDGEQRELLDDLARRGCAVDAELAAFYLPAYLGFQLGHFSLAAQDAPASESARLSREAGRYARLLQRRLAGAG
ncbi:hypothetical protein M2165_004907 [Variovorax sp. TBS-050B]|uniref:hypothetical protein n=1 Tax=Variovorax sp. TBS-050B TaxID=2940551 RepID=UPI0024770C02|nr:hypothetical protein [Variovorax sp. TBS-050B]MDH6595018.1 hypothetical protein [Variovorax sp. TBS-050B]